MKWVKNRLDISSEKMYNIFFVGDLACCQPKICCPSFNLWSMKTTLCIEWLLAWPKKTFSYKTTWCTMKTYSTKGLETSSLIQAYTCYSGVAEPKQFSFDFGKEFEFGYGTNTLKPPENLPRSAETSYCASKRLTECNFDGSWVWPRIPSWNASGYRPSAVCNGSTVSPSVSSLRHKLRLSSSAFLFRRFSRVETYKWK